MKTIQRRCAAALLCICLLPVLLSVTAGAIPVMPEVTPEPEITTPEPERVIDYLSFEEALTCFDFDTAAANWCRNFGMNPATRLEDAKAAIIAGTNHDFIIRLATFARDSGHGDEKLAVTNAFRPAAYQEVIGLYQSNSNTGPYRNAMRWNGRSVTDFWWKAEEQPGWPEAYAIDLSEYDLTNFDVRYFYRAALLLWDNTWVNGYYAKPGCSGHNSGCAMDISNYWLATNFATSYDYNGETYALADYGLYKPLQPSKTSAGEMWHITCAEDALQYGLYDGAFAAGYEIAYGLYYNPSLRGNYMYEGCGIYLGAGVTVIQLRLCQLGYLDQKYVTGYFCSETDKAVRAFQKAQGMDPDGSVGGNTMAALLRGVGEAEDTVAPALTEYGISRSDKGGIALRLVATDDQAVTAFRVDTRRTNEALIVTRYYNAEKGGVGTLYADIWKGGYYEVRAAAVDAAGNESELAYISTVYVDTVPPRLAEITVGDITSDGFTVSLRAEDGSGVVSCRSRLTSDTGEVRENENDGGVGLWTETGLNSSSWTVTVEATDDAGNTAQYTFRWHFEAGHPEPGLRLCHYGH